MILVDSSVRLDHLRRGDPALADLLGDSRVLSYTFVIGELALGNLRQRDVILGALRALPHALVARDDEGHDPISRHALFGLGIGYTSTRICGSPRC